jgi:hypothetical protein
MDELEDLLQRYRPAGPPAELRDRITSAAERDVAKPFRAAESVQRWLPAAAAALIAVVFSMLANGVRRDVADQLGKGELPREAVVSELAASMGGGLLAREEAERLVQLDELRARAEPRGVGAGESEVNHRD